MSEMDQVKTGVVVIPHWCTFLFAPDGTLIENCCIDKEKNNESKEM